MAKSDDKSPFPVFVKGRKGGISVVDAMVQALANGDPAGAEVTPDGLRLTFEQLRVRASEVIGYLLAPSTIRSAVYGHANLFRRCKLSNGKPAVRLEKQVRRKLL